MKVILKFDDFRADAIRWAGNYKSALQIVQDLGLKSCIGIIGVCLDRASVEDLEFIKQYQNVEFYNHSYNHFQLGEKQEFFGTPEDYQDKSITMTQSSIFYKLGYDCETIGFVANSWDDTTIKVIKGLPDIKRVFYLKPNQFRMKTLNTSGKILIEVDAGESLEHFDNENRIDYRHFREKFEQKDLMVYQLHPACWNQRDIEQFAEIIHFLLSVGCEFINPKDI